MMFYILALKGKALYFFLLFWFFSITAVLCAVFGRRSIYAWLVVAISIFWASYTYILFKEEFNSPVSQEQLDALIGIHK